MTARGDLRLGEGRSDGDGAGEDEELHGRDGVDVVVGHAPVVGSDGQELSRDDLPCSNPFCDGYGDIDVSPSMDRRSVAPFACRVGPHPRSRP
jgi:hypothetical protein